MNNQTEKDLQYFFFFFLSFWKCIVLSHKHLEILTVYFSSLITFDS